MYENSFVEDRLGVESSIGVCLVVASKHENPFAERVQFVIGRLAIWHVFWRERVSAQLVIEERNQNPHFVNARLETLMGYQTFRSLRRRTGRNTNGNVGA